MDLLDIDVLKQGNIGFSAQFNNGTLCHLSLFVLL